jgi:uncharacterized protein (TIGR02099 family)
LQESIFHKLSNILWGLAVIAIVLLATYVSVGRLLSTNLQTWQEEVLGQLNSRVPFVIRAQRMGGEWHSFTPEIVLHDLEIDLPGSDTVPLQLSGGRIGIDVLESLGSRSLQFTSLQLEGLDLRGELTADGKFVIPGLTGNGGELGKWLQDFLLNIEYITLQDNTLELLLPGGEQRDYSLDLHLARDGSVRQLTADMLSTAGTDIHLVGRGLGNPFSPDDFEGMLYLQLDAGNLGAVADMLAREPALWMEGRLDSEAWLTWNRGQAGLDMDFEISDLVLKPREGDWSVPLDALSFQATLSEGKNRWTLFANNLNFSFDELEVSIPRVQLDTWGKSLRLRTAQLQLEPLNQLLQALPSMPETLGSVFATLAPRGDVNRLQLSLGDYSNPMSEWDAEGNFDAVEVDSWKGAPGVTSGTGYFELSEAGGYVVIDSQQFTMAYPTLYSQPLYYDDFYGTLNLSWDEQSLLLHSGVITATAVEGTAQAMFALNIPFTKTEVGLEMDLMVGLANSHPIHRVKYVPYTLNQNLLDWLSTAVGEGDVEQAGFVWRGSLRPGASELRTVQLMLNIDNTSLAYHPDWPTVSGVKGVVLIDDTDVSVWAERARLYESIADNLSAEAWMGENGQMRLAVAGRVSGSAEDGLRAVNESLLGRLTRNAFGEWSASGQMQTELHLELNLADKQEPPAVDVRVDFADVDLQIEPGRLPVTDLAGVLRYSSEAGFRSEALTGQLWGEPLALDVSQKSLMGEDRPFNFSDSAVVVGLQSTIDTGDLRRWLDQDALRLASGAAQVEGQISVVPGEVPLLNLRSDLQGVALDLPQPWRKQAKDMESLEVALPLGGEQMVLGIALGEDLSLQLDVSGGGMQAAALGVNTPPPALRDGFVIVAGEAALVDVNAWLDFSDNYLFGQDSQALENAGEADALASMDPNLPTDSPAQASSASMRLLIDEAHAQTLLLWGGEYTAVDFSLDLAADGWQVRGSTDWLQGVYQQPAQGRASLVLDYLDLRTGGDAADSELTAEDVDEPESPQLSLPPVDVDVNEVRLNGKPIGQLTLALESEGSSIQALNIVGDLAGMQLLPEAPGRLLWEQGQRSELQALFTFSDFGTTLDYLGYAQFLETEQGLLDLQLTWPGAPQDVSMAALEGALRLDVEAGRFLETPAGTGALKVVEIVNLADVVSSLSLSHMFESGISFHSMDGEVFFHSGSMEVADLTVQGSSSAFVVSGLTDIGSKSLDGELVATLPVANNLPWVAALAGGLPVAAGVFVVSKVFEKQVNRLSSGVYSIEGTWDDPQINFDRIFDDELRLPGGVVNLPDPNEVLTLPQPATETVDPNAPAEILEFDPAETSAEPEPEADPNQPLP